MDIPDNIEHHDQFEIAAQKIISQVGKTIVLAIPIGIGKPIGILNALYNRAKQDKSINLTIISGLTLSRPLYKNELERRFVEPMLDRLLENYVDPLYERDREQQTVPENIKIIEFFLLPGKFLHNRYVQENYISSAYAFVIRDLHYYNVNVIAQQVGIKTSYPGKYSVGSNCDLFHEAVNYVKTAERPYAVIAEINQNMPFMHGDAIIPASTFTDIIDTKNYPALFGTPREEISIQDHLIGIYSSCLIKDGSCLQIGIGNLSVAIANALIMRHKHNADYLALLESLGVMQKFGDVIARLGDVKPFTEGLYASSEMISDGYINLYHAGILKKRVYDHIGLQRLLNDNLITETVSAKTIDVLLEHKIIKAKLKAKDVKFLKRYGILKSDVIYKDGFLSLPNEEPTAANLASPDTKAKIVQSFLGSHLTNGKIIDAAFFVGSKDFYQQLRELPDEAHEQINMTSVEKTNTMLYSPKLLRAQRKHARFINSALMVTLDACMISDGLANQHELSGVGGQFDFAYMAHNIEGARFVINCRSTRQVKDKLESNIVWQYPNITLPRYLRDVVITEYGIADCRSKTDSEIIKAMLTIADANFQGDLLEVAKKEQKIPKNYNIPAQYVINNNVNAITNIVADYQARGYLKPYPFGSDLTDEEEVIKKVLLALKNMTSFQLLKTLAAALFHSGSDQHVSDYLSRMNLLQPKTWQDHIYKKLMKYMLLKFV